MLKTINKVIKTLIFSDFVLNSGWGLIGPVFAIFLVQNIASANATEGAKIVGFASLTYWVVKSFLQIPIGKYLDKNHGERDDLWFMIIGTFLTGFVPLGYLVSSLPWHIYALQILQALGMAMTIPSWNAVFTRHIDKGQEAFEWGTTSTSLGFATGLAGAAGGILVGIFGFKILFILVGVLTIISALLLSLIHKELSPKDNFFPHIPIFKPPF